MITFVYDKLLNIDVFFYQTFPKFRNWIQGFVDGIDIEEFNPPQEDIEVPESIINQGLFFIFSLD